MTMLTDADRTQARADLDRDERTFRDAEISEYLDQLATEIARIRMLHDAIPTEYPNAEKALALVAAVGKQHRPQGKVATIMHLLDCVQKAAVHQARTHEATWEQIGAQTAESRGNLHTRINR